MRLTTLFFQTTKDAPSDCETRSAILLFRAGYISKLATGIFCYLPLAQRCLRKIKTILREEMDRIGGQEILMPVVHPADIWKRTGRYYTIGDELVRFSDRRGSDMVLAMTHEEVIAFLASQYINSYRQMPALVYQIQTKFRDEPRSRGGLIRVREFDMKDSYSLDVDTAGLDVQYSNHQDAYSLIFKRVGLPVRSVRSDTGMMGGKEAHEYMFLSPIGEDRIVTCPACNYAANQEAAGFRREITNPTADDPDGPLLVKSPGVSTVPDLAAFLQLDQKDIVKHVCLRASYSDGSHKLCVVLVRGDHNVNVTAVRNLVGAMDLQTADNQEIINVGLVPGYIGLQGIAQRENLVTVADVAVQSSGAWVIGANTEGAHLKGAKYGRDFSTDLCAEVALVDQGFPCPQCGAPLDLNRGVEVGNIFKLGTKYSQTLGATYLDKNGRPQPIVMGSYGIGVGRLLACIAEYHNDERGLRWPISVAPFHVILVPIGASERVANAVLMAYSELLAAKIETLWDDRNLGPGAKLTDSELFGIPIRVVISERTLGIQEAEILNRVENATERVKVTDLTSRVQTIIESLSK
jgi:prolyl-tRNA synthetase